MNFMSRTIAFLNMKGGVGKTTLAVNVGYALAKKENKRVLIIDLDPQYNATQYLVDVESSPFIVSGEKPTVFDIMSPEGLGYTSLLDGIKKNKSDKSVQLKDVVRTIWTSLDGESKLELIPSTIHLINLEMIPRGFEHKLQNFIKKIEEAYDYIIIDCPPTFSIFLLSGILASEYYVVTVKPDPLSILGIPLLEAVIENYSENFSKKIKPLGVLFTMVRDTRMMSEVMSGLKQTSIGKRYIFENYTRYTTYYAEASSNHIPIFEHTQARYYGHDKDLEKITKELISLF